MMTTGNDLTGSAASEVVSAPLDLLLTDAVFGALGRLNPGGSGLRLAEPDAFEVGVDLAVTPGSVVLRVPVFANWLGERSGEEMAAPTELGGSGLEPIGDAPGTYLYDR